MIYQKRPGNFNPRFELVSCYLEHDGKILLLHRYPQKSQGGKWGLPAGKVDAGESLESAILREVYEETGLKLDPQNLNYINALDVHHSDYDLVYHTYHYPLSEPVQVTISDYEHQAYAWIEPLKAVSEVVLVDDLDHCIELYYKR